MTASLQSAALASSTPLRKRVLIISPHFPPVNAPDHQRVRIALPYLAENGWEAEILAVQPEQVAHPQDAYLVKVLPNNVVVHRTSALSRRSGLGNLGWRCLPNFVRMGDRLLSQKSFDLIFFSTTLFPVMALGPYWKQRFGVPFVLDFQDPWRVEQAPVGQHRPGGRLKYALDKGLAALMEPPVVKAAAHMVTVSPSYPAMFQARYPQLQDEQFTVLPFGAPEEDFRRLPELRIQQTHFNPQDGRRHWVYVGRGGPDMERAAAGLFLALRQLGDRYPDLGNRLHLYFIGTSYGGDRAIPTLHPIAIRYGIGDWVTEHPQRIPYFEAQQLLVDSDAIVMIGSSDARYSASKLYPALLANRPILAIFHENSLVVDILRQTNATTPLTFHDNTPPAELAEVLMPQLEQLLRSPQGSRPPTRWDAFAPYTARTMTQTLCQIFDQICSVAK